MGAAKGKQPNTEALCQPAPGPWDTGRGSCPPPPSPPWDTDRDRDGEQHSAQTTRLLRRRPHMQEGMDRIGAAEATEEQADAADAGRALKRQREQCRTLEGGRCPSGTLCTNRGLVQGKGGILLRPERVCLVEEARSGGVSNALGSCVPRLPQTFSFGSETRVRHRWRAPHPQVRDSHLNAA